MAEIRNLTEENVSDLTEYLERMKIINKDLEYTFFVQEESYSDDEERTDISLNELKESKESIESIERKLNLIFDGHVLIDGEFKKIQAG